MTDKDGSTHEDQLIDARGLACPLPVLRLRKTLLGVAAGTCVTLLATDRAARRDVPAYCAASGHAVIAQSEDGPVLRFVVRKNY